MTIPPRSRMACLAAIAFAVSLMSACELFNRRGGGGDGTRDPEIVSLGDYRLGVGNSIFMEMFQAGESVLAEHLVVEDDGDLEVPRVGDVSVVGMTPLAAAKKIEFLARKSGQNHLGGPRVHIKALDLRAVVHVSGHVGRSGPVTFHPGLTIARAIEAAGGTTADANRGSVSLTSGGRKSIVTALGARELKEGDVVNVPRRL